MYIKREDYINKIRPFINKNIVKILTGIRRSGKSVMLHLIKEELNTNGISEDQIISHNFDSLDNTGYENINSAYATIKQIAGSADDKLYLFFDEIQELDNWERLINSCMVDFNCDIYLTGSNSKMLSHELSTLLSGRYVSITIFPFSYKEICEIKSNNNSGISYPYDYPYDYAPSNVMSKDDAFKYYVTYGGMPQLYNGNYSRDEGLTLLSDVFDSIILNDISKRYNIRTIDLFMKIVLFLFDNVGHTFSASSIVKFLKNENRSTSNETIYDYIDYCQSAYLLNMVKREDIRGKKLLKTQEKIYLTDHGFREVLLGSNDSDIEQILENIIYIELLRRGYHVRIGKINDNEIDFIASKNKEKIYIQVSYLLSTEKTVEREFGIYKKISDNHPKYVLSLDEFDLSRDGIIHMNIKDFLLQ